MEDLQQLILDKKMDNFCEKIASYDFINPEKVSKIVFVLTVGCLSTLGGACVASIMWFNKKLMAFPNELIFYTCIAESIACYSCVVALLGTEEVICYFEIQKTLAATYWGGYTEQQAFKAILTSNSFCLQYFQFVSLVLNFFLCLDLILTLRKPFYPHERRMKFYKYLTPVIAWVLTSNTTDRISFRKQQNSLKLESTFGCMTISCYILFAIFSCAYSHRITQKPGMSAELRQEFIVRRTQYILAQVFTWLPYLGLTYLGVYLTANYEDMRSMDEIKGTDFYDMGQILFKANLFSSMTTGILLSYFRVKEPVFWAILKKSIARFFCIQTESENNLPINNTLLSFLMSSMNIELVHIILYTVSKKTVGTAKSTTDYKVYQSYDHKNKSEFVLDSIEIEDRHTWDVTQVVSLGNNALNLRKTRKGDVLSVDRLIINEDIRITEWAPDVFAFLRVFDGYSNKILMESLDPEHNADMVFKAGEGSGKSGSFFFFSKDQKFIIKTMTDEDLVAFQGLQKSYFQRVCSDNTSLLARVYGIYTVKIEDQAPVNLIVIENCLLGATNITAIFDLKGSMVNREFKPKNGEKFTSTQTLKDLNLLKMFKKSQLSLNFREKDRQAILASLKKDVDLLTQFQLMDYSLLMCIQDNPRYLELRGQRLTAQQLRQQLRSEFKARKDATNTLRHKFLSQDCTVIYHIGIIDYLQDWSLSKRVENYFKQEIQGDLISAVPPEDYGHRFLRFMSESVIVNQRK